MNTPDNYVQIDPLTTQLALHLPLAKLMVDGGKAVGFELGLSTPYSKYFKPSDIDLVPSGVYADRVTAGTNNPNFREFSIPLYDGRIIAFGTRTIDTPTRTITLLHSTPISVISASHNATSSTYNTAGRSSTIASNGDTKFRASDFRVDISYPALAVHHTNGVSEIFDIVAGPLFSGEHYGAFKHHPLLRREISYPCGTRLNFKWEDKECPRISEINDGASKLLVATWWQGKKHVPTPPDHPLLIPLVIAPVDPLPKRILEEAVFFPGTDKEFACRGVSPESRNFDVSGSGIDGKKRHSIG